MVTNIGFGTDATHTTGADPDRALASVPIETPLVHPPAVIPMRSLDEIDQRLAFLSLFQCAFDSKAAVAPAY